MIKLLFRQINFYNLQPDRLKDNDKNKDAIFRTRRLGGSSGPDSLAVSLLEISFVKESSLGNMNGIFKERYLEIWEGGKAEESVSNEVSLRKKSLAVSLLEIWYAIFKEIWLAFSKKELRLVFSKKAAALDHRIQINTLVLLHYTSGRESLEGSEGQKKETCCLFLGNMIH